MLQSSQGQQIIQPGQQIVVQGIGGSETMQQIQVIPSSGGSGSQILLQQPSQTQQAQVIQTADGQTLIYQPVPVSQDLFLSYSYYSL